MAGLTITQCRVDHAFSLVVADEPAGSFEVRIERSFTVAGSGDELTLDPEGDPVLMAPALRLLRQEIQKAIAFKDGRLELTFGDGAVLRVPIGEQYEPWEIVAPAGARIVSLPGGELAIWSPEDGDDRSD